MITFLSDHNIEGQIALLWRTFDSEGWLSLTGANLATFYDVNLPINSSDRAVWDFVQSRGMLLITGNRNMKGDDSLEQTIREQNHPTALPVLTIGNVERLLESEYRKRCAIRLAEIVMYLDDDRGIGRLFVP